jgi:hypothetical protein
MFAKFVAAISANKRLWSVLVIFAGLLLLLRILAGPSSAQTPSSAEDSASRNERILESLIKDDVPIKIKIKQDKEASFKDLQNERWLSEFELELTNTGDKPIYFLYITMGTGVNVGGQEIVFPLHYGRPELGDIVTKAEPDDVPIKPGETYVMKVGGGASLGKGSPREAVASSNKVSCRASGTQLR